MSPSACECALRPAGGQTPGFQGPRPTGSTPVPCVTFNCCPRFLGPLTSDLALCPSWGPASLLPPAGLACSAGQPPVAKTTPCSLPSCTCPQRFLGGGSVTREDGAPRPSTQQGTPARHSIARWGLDTPAESRSDSAVPASQLVLVHPHGLALLLADLVLEDAQQLLHVAPHVHLHRGV